MKPAAAWNRYRVGLIGFAVLAFLAALIGAASTLTIGAATYTVELEHTGGLRVGEEVQVAGVGVGEVTEIELADRKVLASFTVDDDLDLGQETTVEVKVATLLGTHFLLISPLGTGELADDLIPMAQTRVPYNLQDVLDDLAPEVDDFDAEAIEQSLGQLAGTLDRSGDELAPALTGVRELSTLVATRSEDLGALLKAARQVTGQLNDSGGDLITLMRQADVILDVLRARRETIHGLLTDLATLGTQLDGVIKDTREDLAPTLRDLNKTIALLEKHEKALDTGLRTLATSARYFANAGGTGTWLDQYAPGATPDNVECAESRGC